ncbi:PTS glucose transporter subunit IIA [Clostridium sediminicola]|uniref:PTS sugar transporter subunit IIA n=1 Tax=Clostridium sediminicola TaxID=3114879 RepID=UPI0031F20E19
MFKFIDKIMNKRDKSIEILTAPVDGKVIDITKVQDKVFSEKIIGDGIAIESSGKIFIAPASGELKVIFETNHAFAMTLENGIDILVHIGIDTVKLNGEGFKRLANEGEMVKKGQPIIEIDRELIEGGGYSLVTPVLVTNMESLETIDYCNLGESVVAGNDNVFKIKAK